MYKQDILHVLVPLAELLFGLGELVHTPAPLLPTWLPLAVPLSLSVEIAALCLNLYFFDYTFVVIWVPLCVFRSLAHFSVRILMLIVIYFWFHLSLNFLVGMLSESQTQQVWAGAGFLTRSR